MNHRILVKVDPYRSLIAEIIAHYGSKARALSHARICVATYERIINPETTHIAKQSAQSIMNAWKAIAPYNQPESIRLSKWYLHNLDLKNAQYARHHLRPGHHCNEYVDATALSNLQK